MAYLSLIGTPGQTSATFQINGLGFNWASDQYQYAYTTAGSQTSPSDYPPPPPGSGTSTGTMTVSGLTAGTSYTAYGYVYTAPPGNQLINVGTYSFTTDAPPPPADTTAPFLSVSFSVFDTSVKLTWSSNDYDFYQAQFQFSTSPGGPFTQFLTSFAAVSNFTHTGLLADTDYYYQYNVRDTTGNFRYYSPSLVHTLKTLPPRWEWETPKIANQTFYLNATEWNNFTARINQYRYYKGLAAYSFTTAPYDASRKVYGWMYNQAVSAMSPMVTLPAETAATKTTGDIIKAIYFINLRDYLNTIT